MDLNALAMTVPGTRIQPLAATEGETMPAVAGAAENAPSPSLLASFPAIPEQQVGHVTLPNGTHVVLNDRPGATTMSLQIGTAAGGRNDGAHPGKSHLVEHMTFEGTPLNSHRDIWRQIQAQGSMGNAGTTQDSIVFSTEVSNTDASDAVRLFTDLYAHPNSNRYQLAREKRIVQEEMRASCGAKSKQGTLELYNLVFGPDSVPPSSIGDVENVAAIGPAELRAYTGKYFTGANTVAMIDGDIDQLGGPIEDLVKGLMLLEPGERVAAPESPKPQPGAKLELVDDPGQEQANVSVVFPNLSGDRKPIRDMLLRTVAKNKLFQAVRERERLTYTPSVGAMPSPVGGRGAGLLTQVSLNPAELSKGVESVVRTVRRLPDSITDTDVETAKQQMYKQLALQASDPSADANSLFESLLDDGSAEIPSEHALMAALSMVTPAELRTAARKTFDPQHMKILATGKVAGSEAAIEQGVADGGWNVQFERVPFRAEYYQKKLATPTGPLHP